MLPRVFLLALVAPLVCATIVLQAPNGTVSTNAPATFTWTSSDNADPVVFDLVLENTAFNKVYAIANNVPTSDGSITVVIPTVSPGTGYTVQAVNISDINDVYSSFGQFDIAPAPSTTQSSSATKGRSSSSATLPPGSFTGISTTATGSGTVSSSSSVTSSGTTTGSTTGTQTSANTASSTPFSGASQATSSYTALALSALAGITFLAF